ncbi:MAG: metallophosphoesterase [Deltaproteobacteria bacterium]|nr:metallophosphoesterase [Deltaproteobacteria bacterium]
MQTVFKKIKLVVSDFHLGAGHRNPDGSINILEDFFHDREFIEFLEYFASGVYEDAEVEVILNGDFFNLLMIDYEEIDPDVVTEFVAIRRMKKIMDGHKAVMNALKYFQSLPQKQVTFVMGNHDPGILFTSVQTLISLYVGDKTRFFLESYEFDGVYVEHGNQYEVANQFDRTNYFLTKNLPEPILNQPWGTLFLVHVVNKIKRTKPHFDKVLPFGTYLKWLMLYDFRFGMQTISRIVKFFFKSRFRDDPRRKNTLRQTFNILIEAPLFPDLDDAAERILATREDIHAVIFGHNHRPTFRQFGPGKEYINTGTWNKMTHLDVDRLGTRLVCTFAMIEYGGRVPAVSLKIWKGKRRHSVEADVA